MAKLTRFVSEGDADFSITEMGPDLAEYELEIDDRLIYVTLKDVEEIRNLLIEFLDFKKET